MPVTKITFNGSTKFLFYSLIFESLKISAMNWRLAVIPVTLIPIIIIAIQFDIEAEDIFAIGAIPFALAVLAIMTKLGLQGLKLAYIARTFLGPFDSIKRLTAMRVGSEFIKCTTPMFVGAEFAVIYYMTKKGIPTSKASWVALLDIVTVSYTHLTLPTKA